MAPRSKTSSLAVRRRMNDAIDAVNNGYTYREAAQKYSVSASTSHRKINRIEHKAGRRKALTDAEEDIIVNFLSRYSDRGIPLTQIHQCEAIQIVVSRMPLARRLRLPFKRGVPGRAFLRAFRKRHVDKLRFGNSLRQENNRFKAVNCEVLTTHFAVLDKLIEENGLDATRVFNLDECGTTPDKDLKGHTAAKRLMTRNGSRDYRIPEFKYLHRVKMMPVISASGHAAPPLFIFKGSRLPYRMIKCGGTVVEQTPLCCLPHGSTAALRLENGGVDTQNFRNWAYSFVDHVRPLTRNGRKVLLIYDGYRAHLSLDVLEIFNDNNVVVYALPAHTSGKTQPLDVVPFSVLKNALNTVLINCNVRKEKQPLDIFGFCSLLKEAYETSFTPTNIRAGFKRSVVWPLDERRILDVARPASAEDNAPIKTVDELEAAFVKKREEYRKRVLGDDAKITASGFVDTTNGCVMTAPSVLEMVGTKHNQDLRKRAEEETKRLEKRRKGEAIRLRAIQFAKQLRQERMSRCAQLSGQNYDEFVGNVRSMEERRMVVKVRAGKKVGDA